MECKHIGYALTNVAQYRLWSLTVRLVVIYLCFDNLLERRGRLSILLPLQVFDVQLSVNAKPKVTDTLK